MKYLRVPVIWCPLLALPPSSSVTLAKSSLSLGFLIYRMERKSAPTLGGCGEMRVKGRASRTCTRVAHSRRLWAKK